MVYGKRWKCSMACENVGGIKSSNKKMMMALGEMRVKCSRLRWVGKATRYNMM